MGFMKLDASIVLFLLRLLFYYRAYLKSGDSFLMESEPNDFKDSSVSAIPSVTSLVTINETVPDFWKLDISLKLDLGTGARFVSGAI
jgi:hypothetical protein